MPVRPLIAVTRPDTGTKRDGNFKHFNFILPLLGARVVRVSPEQKIDLSQIDGLILSGGADIHPSHYNEEERPNYRHEPDRDTMEMDIFHYFKTKKKPIMGVCRGMQMINVCLGGSMHQEIAEHFEGTQYPKKYPAKYFYRKPVNIKPNTLLSHLFKKEEIDINSLHHQAINELGNGLRVTAIEPKGIIQGIEHKEIDNIFGVQWHPELMHFNLDQWKLFKHFVCLCA